MNTSLDPITNFDHGVRVTIKARPGANRTRGARFVDIGDGKSALEITVSAPPEDGKANKAIVQHIAKALGLKAAQLTVKTGQSARLKVIEIVGDPVELRDRIQKWACLERETE